MVFKLLFVSDDVCSFFKNKSKKKKKKSKKKPFLDSCVFCPLLKIVWLRTGFGRKAGQSISKQ